MEVEKKFLVKRMPKLDWGNSYEIEQGYLSLDPEIRVRKKGNSFFITQKGNGDFVREEIEQSISKETYAILSQLVQGNLVTKTRFEIPIENGYLAELDIYHGNLSGLVTVEVEFEDEASLRRLAFPDWFGSDVTDDKQYKNKNLSLLDDVSSLLDMQVVRKVKKMK